MVRELVEVPEVLREVLEVPEASASALALAAYFPAARRPAFPAGNHLGIQVSPAEGWAASLCLVPENDPLSLALLRQERHEAEFHSV